MMTASRRLAVIIAVAATAAAVRADEPKAGAAADHKLVGTWKSVSAKYGGREVKRPEGYTHVKHVTPTQFMWAMYDQDGTVTRAAGGDYTLKGDEYEETTEYGVGEEFKTLLKGKTHPFKWKIEKNRWHHSGKLSTGLTIDEVWERVEKK